MEATTVADDVGDNPRGGGTTDDEGEMFAMGGPSVPEMFQFGDEAGTRRVQPGELVEEDDGARGRGSVKEPFEGKEGFAPRCEGGAVGEAVAEKGIAEMKQLVAQRAIGKTNVFKGECVGEGFADEIGFSYTAATVDGDELRFLGVEGVEEEALFVSATYEHVKCLIVVWQNPCILSRFRQDEILNCRKLRILIGFRQIIFCCVGKGGRIDERLKKCDKRDLGIHFSVGRRIMGRPTRQARTGARGRKLGGTGTVWQGEDDAGGVMGEGINGRGEMEGRT